MKKKITITVVLLVLIGLGTAYYLFQKPVQSLRGETPAWTGTGNQLFNAFTADEASGNKKFTGKVLQVSGVVAEIMQNADSSKTLILKSTHPVFGVKCRLDPKYNSGQVPAKGSKVLLKGLCTGINSDVELNQCVIL